MKKIIYLILTILILTIIFIISDLINLNKKTTIERSRLEKMIELKKEINLEYSYLFEQAKNQNINEQLDEKREEIKKNKNTIEQLKTETEELKQENEEQIEKIETLKEEKRKKEKEEEIKSIVKIENEITYSQFPEYPTGCESIALYILLKYHNVNVTPEEIITKLKKGQLPYEIEDKMYGGNPELEFIGNPTDDFSYGVYNTPIAQVANTFKENIQNKEGLELEEILEIVSEERPVMVWTTLNNVTSRNTSSWIYRPTGETIYWKHNEHAVVIIGYSNNTIIVSDPYTGKIEKYNREKFKQNYNYLGKRAVYY